MKLNWGKGIVFMIAFFLIVWAGLIVFAFNQKVDLVTPNYYEQELKYQQEIEKQKNTLALNGKVDFEYTNSSLTLRFPVNEVGRDIQGSIKLYRPSDSRYDRTFPLATDSTGMQQLTTTSMAKGLWKVKVQWHTPVQHYYYENDMRIE